MIRALSALFFLISFTSFGNSLSEYQVNIDLSSLKDDQLNVSVRTPSSEEDYVEYQMAKIVPGTYEESDFGSFVNRLKAYDSIGTELDVERISENRWKIQNGGRLNEINYWVHDTFDRFGDYGDDVEDYIFEPNGTNFDRYTNSYVINTFGVVGYLEGMKNLPYQLQIKHSPKIYGASALEKDYSGDTLDIFKAADFNFLADGPIMYTLPDTVSRQIANAKVTVSSYSPNRKVTSEQIMDKIYDLMLAQAAYLGGELPVDHYSYLIYMVDDKVTPYFGALEHSYSTLFYLFENDIDYIGKNVRDVGAHEFFHIVTPLNIHSEEIGNFDYINPKMSKHLWLYEGVTEYSSMHVQVKYGLYNVGTFIEEIRQKLYEASMYPNVSFTYMSEHILEPRYEAMYPNVYAKGALIGLCMDLHLLKYSGGTYDLQDLMRDLSSMYGKDKAFKDDELFDVIEKLTYPEVRDFLDKYVAGNEPLPMKEVLSWVGIDYIEEGEESDISFGNVGFQQNEDGQMIITDISEMDVFGRKIGFEKGDLVVSVNDKSLDNENLYESLNEYFSTTLPGDKVAIKVLRPNKRGKLKSITLKAKALKTTRHLSYELGVDDEITNAEQNLLLTWLTPDQPIVTTPSE
ncbi:MAG: peptidase M61 [Bacteroidota bacterium]